MGVTWHHWCYPFHLDFTTLISIIVCGNELSCNMTGAQLYVYSEAEQKSVYVTVPGPFPLWGGDKHT